MSIYHDQGWAQKLTDQSNDIKNWIQEKCDKTDPLFESFLKGENVAGLGQGRFSNNAKGKLKDNWDSVVPLLEAVVKCQNDLFAINEKEIHINQESSLYKACSDLQTRLIAYCKKKKGEDEVDEHRPWAAIHAMIAAMLPNIFCTIVTEGNLDELYKKLEEAHCDTSTVEKPYDTDTIDTNSNLILYENSTNWDTLRNKWKAINKNNKNNKEYSWYYRSAAIQEYFSSCLSQGTSVGNYPWETLVALRGEATINRLAEKLKRHKNLILTGAPGTGKTYLSRRIAAALIGDDNKINIGDEKIIELLNKNEQYHFVQFHPSYDYTDFVEGLRPTTKNPNSKEIVFERKDGTFKDFCKKAAKAETENPQKNFVFVIDEINRGEISKIFGELFFSIDPGYRGEKDTDGFSNRVMTQYQNLIPTPSKEPEDNNQGSNQDNKEEDFSTGFYVPKNVFIIGTMNDIDRSVESMDFAFRRRFAFHEITATDSQAMIYDADSKDVKNTTDARDPYTAVSKKDKDRWDDEKKQSAVDMMESLNKALITKCGLSSQYQIGGAYFLKYKDAKFNPDTLWNDFIRGTLYEYFRGLPQKEIDEKMKILKNAYDNGIDE